MYIEEDSDYIIYSIGKSPVMHQVKAIRYMLMKRSTGYINLEVY